MDRGPCARPQISFVAPIVLLNEPTFSHNGDFCKLRVVNSRCIVSCGNYYPMQCAASQVPECFGTSQRVRFRVCQPKNEQVLRNWKKRARAKRAYVCALFVVCTCTHVHVVKVLTILILRAFLCFFWRFLRSVGGRSVLGPFQRVLARSDKNLRLSGEASRTHI